MRTGREAGRWQASPQRPWPKQKWTRVIRHSLFAAAGRARTRPLVSSDRKRCETVSQNSRGCCSPLTAACWTLGKPSDAPAGRISIVVSRRPQRSRHPSAFTDTQLPATSAAALCLAVCARACACFGTSATCVAPTLSPCSSVPVAKRTVSASPPFTTSHL